jgi:catechol 2,3-dioxygenase-like lactoylglutathione lyase family enzyme
VSVQLNHTIVSCRDQKRSAAFLTGILGLPPATAFGRIRERDLAYWADPGRSRRGAINHRDGGRGLYFEDPDGHLLEIITRPYGSGG